MLYELKDVIVDATKVNQVYEVSIVSDNGPPKTMTIHAEDLEFLFQPASEKKIDGRKSVLVKMLVDVHPEIPHIIRPKPGQFAIKGATYPGIMNKQGAICIFTVSGDLLGVKPGEFEIIPEHNHPLEFSEGAELIAIERARQTCVEGYDDSHDDRHAEGSMAIAAALYALVGTTVQNVIGWPWAAEYDKRTQHAACDNIRGLTIAGALIAAEIDRRRRIQIRRSGAGNLKPGQQFLKAGFWIDAALARMCQELRTKTDRITALETEIDIYLSAPPQKEPLDIRAAAMKREKTIRKVELIPGLLFHFYPFHQHPRVHFAVDIEKNLLTAPAIQECNMEECEQYICALHMAVRQLGWMPDPNGYKKK